MIQAVRDQIIVKTVYDEKVGSIFIPDKKGAKEYHSGFYGLVISVGPKYPYDVKPGDKIYYRRHEGKNIYYEGEWYKALKSRWVEGKMADEG